MRAREMPHIVSPVRQYYAYILASKSRTLYNGASNDLVRRVWEHRNGLSKFTSTYRIHRLVYYEVFDTPMAAIIREKQIKHMLRSEKIALIESTNPTWSDLAKDWY